MTRRVIGALSAMLLLAASPTGLAHAASTAPAVRAVWAEIDAAWNARDPARFSALYTEDASFEFVDRRHAMHGRAAIHTHFEQQFPRIDAAYSHHTRISSIRPIAGGAVTIDGVVEVRRAAAEAGQEPSVFRTFAIFAVMVPADGAWRIDALRVYELPDEPAP